MRSVALFGVSGGCLFFRIMGGRGNGGSGGGGGGIVVIVVVGEWGGTGGVC